MNPLFDISASLLAKAHLPVSNTPKVLSQKHDGVLVQHGRYVTKQLENAPGGMFHSQGRALFALAQCGFKVQELFWQDRNGLVLNHLEGSAPDNEPLAKTLAKLHQLNVGQYGWDTPLFFSTLELPNTAQPDWTSFFWHNRVQPLLELLQLPQTQQDAIAKAFEHLPSEGPVLIHGNLEGANLLQTGGNITLLNPACWWGERALDVARLRMTSQLPDKFWSLYQLLCPMSQEVKQAIPRYQLYYTLLDSYFGTAHTSIEQALQALEV